MCEIHTLPGSPSELPEVESIKCVVLEHVKHSHLYRCLGTCYSEGEKYEVEISLPIKKLKHFLGIECLQGMAPWIPNPFSVHSLSRTST